MENFIAQENIRRFSRLLAEEGDDVRRQQIQNLLEEERLKLRSADPQAGTLPK